MEVEVNENAEEFTDFFWIVQKIKKVYEGEIECIGSGRNENCYEAKRRRRISGNRSGNVTYELELRIDTLEREDIELKLFLLKDFRNYNSKIDQFEVYPVPRSRAGSRSINDFSGKLNSKPENGCYIKQELVEFGDFIEYPEFCIKVICQDSGNIDVRSMRESDCRRRRTRN